VCDAHASMVSAMGVTMVKTVRMGGSCSTCFSRTSACGECFGCYSE
jgi:hypothetical protein